MPRLIVCQNGHDYRVVEFEESLTLGREADNALVLPSPQVSRYHAVIHKVGTERFILQDKSSTNGIWFEQKRVAQQVLTSGITFRIIDFYFTYIQDEADESLTKVFGQGELDPGEDERSESATILFAAGALPDVWGEGTLFPALQKKDSFFDILPFSLEKLAEQEDELSLGKILLELAIDSCGAERGFLALVNAKHELLYTHTQQFDVKQQRREIRQDIIQKAMAGQGGLYVAEACGDFSLGKQKRAARSVLCWPLIWEGAIKGCLYMDYIPGVSPQDYAASCLHLFALQGASCFEILGHRKRLHCERQSLKNRLAAKDETIIRSEKMVRLYEDIRTIAPINVPVFISGEAGSGKEHVALALHSFSVRKGAYIPLNCAAIPEGIFESELFGSRKGAFHEAVDKPGKLELAEGGTLFLDEVADMALAAQPKLLRFLENGEVTRLGETRLRTLHVRVVTATNRDVEAMIQEKSFRDDLFQRLSCFTLRVPPLRERVEDIEPLTRYFLKRFAHEYNWQIAQISDGGMQLLLDYSWPGNIRQLRNVLLKLAVQAHGRRITEADICSLDEDFGGPKQAPLRPFPSLSEMEKTHIEAALKHAQGNISDAASLIGIARSTLYQKMKKYEIVY